MQQENMGIPKKWVSVSLDHVCEILDYMRIPINAKERSERIDGKHKTELYPYYGATGQVGVIDGFLFDGEFVLLGEDGAPFLDAVKDKAYLVTGQFWVNNHAHILKSPVSNKYLCHYLNQINYSEHVKGTTRLKLNQTVLKKIPIKFAPENEQHRIVAKIEELFSELDRGIESLKTAREQLKVYRQAVLKHAFEGKLTAQWREENKDKLESADQLLARIQMEHESSYRQQMEEWREAAESWVKKGKEGKKPTKPKKPVVTGNPEIPEDLAKHCTDHWSWMKLDDVSEVSGGLTKNQKRSALPKRMKYLRVANVYADRLLLDEITEIGVTEEEFHKLKLTAGDLLVVEGNGSIEQIGRLAVWTGKIDQIGHQNHLIRVRLIDGMLPRFFLLFLLSPLGRKFIIKQASSTSGLHTLSISKVSGLPVPIPSIYEQEALLTEVDEILSQIDKMESDIFAEATRSETLRQSILKKAFSGQLVEQDLNDEPASILLERIKAENAKQAKPGKKKKRKTAA